MSQQDVEAIPDQNPSFDSVTAGTVVANKIETQRIVMTGGSYQIDIKALPHDTGAGIWISDRRSGQMVGMTLFQHEGPVLLLHGDIDPDGNGPKAGAKPRAHNLALALLESGRPVMQVVDAKSESIEHVNLADLQDLVEKAVAKVSEATAPKTATGEPITGTRVVSDTEFGVDPFGDAWRRIELAIATPAGHTLQQSIYVTLGPQGRHLKQATTYAPAIV